MHQKACHYSCATGNTCRQRERETERKRERAWGGGRGEESARGRETVKKSERGSAGPLQIRCDQFYEHRFETNQVCKET